MHAEIITWIYTKKARPKIAYVAAIWPDRTKLGTTVRKLHKVQRIDCVSISGEMRTWLTIHPCGVSNAGKEGNLQNVHGY